jgi:hypothetical protein
MPIAWFAYMGLDGQYNVGTDCFSLALARSATPSEREAFAIKRVGTGSMNMSVGSSKYAWVDIGRLRVLGSWYPGPTFPTQIRLEHISENGTIVHWRFLRRLRG